MSGTQPSRHDLDAQRPWALLRGSIGVEMNLKDAGTMKSVELESRTGEPEGSEEESDV